MDQLKQILKMFTLQDWVDILTLILGAIGGAFALCQWRKSVVYKRGEIVQQLIQTVRDDDDISTIMSIVDWNKEFYYDGSFHRSQDTHGRQNKINTDNELFNKIDKTLSHFSYVCYLRNNRTLKKKDMNVFEYELRRLVDNEHIANYLYSLHHWSAALNVEMSFSYLLKYCQKRKFINGNDIRYPSTVYTCYLRLPSKYVDGCKKKKRLCK